MWLLRKTDGTIQYLISKKKSYTVGRKNCDIVLSDSSISRTHCTINIAARKDCPFTVQTLSGVWVIDQKSKYGTFIHKDNTWQKIEEEKVQELSDGTVIRFGLMENIWRLEYKPVIACTSRLSSEQTQELKSLLAEVDGRLINKWFKQCSAVFVNDITLTVKVLLALINGIPIVTVNYLKELIENVKQNLPWPDYKMFKPEIAESTLVSHLVSLNTEDHRKELFKGKKFIIPTGEQLENLREIIVAAGGEAELLQLDGNWRKLAQENTVVIQLPCNKIIHPDQSSHSFKNLASVLKNEYHVRVVPETEIFQAIAYSSVEKYCNPKSQEFEIRQSSNDQNSCGDVLEEETPTQSDITKPLEERQVGSCLVQSGQPAGCSSLKKSNVDVLLGRKRNRSPEQEEPPKRVALDIQESSGNVVEPKPLAGANDVDLFWEESDKHESVQSAKTPKPTRKESLLKNLESLNLSTKDSHSERTAGVSNSSDETDARKQRPTDDSGYELSDFWMDVGGEKPGKSAPEKRKGRSDSFEMVEEGKRRRVGEEGEGSRRNDPPVHREAKSSRATRATEQSYNSDNERGNGKSLSDALKLAKGRAHGHNYEAIGWIRRKNSHGDNNDDGDDEVEERQESNNLNLSVKRFRKCERFVTGTAVELTCQEYENIAKGLMGDGWFRSNTWKSCVT